MKVAPLNRLQYSRILGIGINLFGHIFCPVEYLEKVTEKKKKKGPVPAGPKQLWGSRPSQRGGLAEPAHSARARPPILNVTAGARRSGRERGAGTRERMTGGAHLSSLTRGQGGRGAHRRRCRPRRAPASAGMASGDCRTSVGGGLGRRGCLVRWRRGAAAEELREAVTPAVSGGYREGKRGGNGQGVAGIPDRGRGGAGEAYVGVKTGGS